MNKELKQKVIDKIKADKLMPTKKWHYQAKELALYLGLGLVTVAGIVATAMSMFLIKVADWDVLPQLNQGRLSFISLSLPLFWLVIVISAVLFASLIFSKSETGYHYKRASVLGVVLLISIIGGLVISSRNDARRLEQNIFSEIPFYQKLHHQREIKFWSTPELGQLSGRLTLQTPQLGNLQDFSGNVWQVLITEQTDSLPIMKNTEIVKILGTQTGESEFTAERILPWERPLPPRLMPRRGSEPRF